MVVDDEPDVAELFRQRFRREVREGVYAMHFAGSAEEALGKLDDGVRPELIVILSDISLPGMDGLGLLRAVKHPVCRAAGDHGRQPTATTSAGAGGENEYGAAEFVTKPVDFDLLEAASPATATAVAPGRNGVTEAVKILAVDDEPDFETLIRQRFRQRIRAVNLEFRFARHGEEALGGAG